MTLTILYLAALVASACLYAVFPCYLFMLLVMSFGYLSYESIYGRVRN